MSFMVVKVIQVLDRGILVKDNYDYCFRVLWDDVQLEDRDAIQEGSSLLVDESGKAELSSNSFVRWRQNILEDEIALSNEETVTDG